MPNILVEIPEVENAIARPVVTEIVRQLAQITGIDAKNLKILMPGDIEESYQKGSTLDKVNTLDNRTGLPFTNQLKVEVIEDTFRESMILSRAKGIDNIPFYLDNNLLAQARPVKNPVEVTLNIDYRAESKAQAIAWKNRLESKLMNYGDINLHTATYHYMVPPLIVSLIKHIHTLRENVAPYGETFQEYLAGYVNSQATVITSQDGKGTDLAIAETQIRVQGLYDFEVRPEKGQAQDGGSAWITSFSYKFTYDKPIQVNMTYPVMVHNQLIDPKFIPIDNAPNLDNHRKSFSLSGNVFHFFEATNEIHRFKNNIHKVVTIPKFDEFRPDVQVHDTGTLFTALLNVDPDQPKLLLNLKDIGDYQIDPDVLEYLESEWKWLTVPYKIPYHISLYKSTKLMEEKSITSDIDLNITTVNDMNLRHVHQLRFSIVTDIDSINLESLQRLKQYPKALVKTLLAMNVNMAQLKLISQRVDFTEIMKEHIKDGGYSWDYIHRNRIQYNTVNSSYVLAKRLDRKQLNAHRTAKTFIS